MTEKSLLNSVIKIQRYWRRFVYNSCPICYETKLLIKDYDCCHRICKDCIMDWNLRNPTCPLCRSNRILIGNQYYENISEFNNNIRYNNINNNTNILLENTINNNNTENNDMIIRYLDNNNNINSIDNNNIIINNIDNENIVNNYNNNNLINHNNNNLIINNIDNNNIDNILNNIYIDLLVDNVINMLDNGNYIYDNRNIRTRIYNFINNYNDINPGRLLNDISNNNIIRNDFWNHIQINN